MATDLKLQQEVDRRARAAQVNECLAFVRDHDGELLKRLEDA